jgi:hypothetical protein
MMIGTHKTKISRDDGVIRVKYHNTDVVTYEPNRGTVTLNTGGYFTATTKKRMNQAAEHYGLGFKVKQVDWTWYVELENKELLTFDGNTLVILPTDHA